MNELLDNLIRLKINPKFPYIYDVELNNISALKRYESVEVHLILYPYSRRILAEGYRFTPFEDYANDISTRRRSLYTRVPHPANSLFGIFLGVFIILIFLALKSSEVYSLQSFVAILGAYFIGKDLWNDIEAALVNLSKDWKLRYQTSYYEYQVEKNTTLTNYSALAREQRYGRATLLPAQMEFIANANSKTVRMKFVQGDLRGFDEESAHVLGIRLDPELADEFVEAGFMFSVKISLNQKRTFLRFSREFFQSLNAGQRGCLNFVNDWTPEAVLERDAYFFGSLRYLAGKELVPKTAMVGM